MLIRVIDVELTGGFEPPDAAVCEIAFCDVAAARTDLAGDPIDWAVGDMCAAFVDPGRPITPESSAVHHIVDEDVRGAGCWEKVARDFVGPTAISTVQVPIIAYAAHSAQAERLFITDEMTGGAPWICTYKCALRLWRDAPTHSNQGLRYWRRPAGLARATALYAHRAMPDAYVTAFHVRDLLALAPLANLIAWSSEPALQVRCRIGKQRGMLWTDVDFGFLEWVADRDFDEDTHFTVKHEIDRRRKAWEAEREAERARHPEAVGAYSDEGAPF